MKDEIIAIADNQMLLAVEQWEICSDYLISCDDFSLHLQAFRWDFPVFVHEKLMIFVYITFLFQSLWLLLLNLLKFSPIPTLGHFLPLLKQYFKRTLLKIQLENGFWHGLNTPNLISDITRKSYFIRLMTR